MPNISLCVRVDPYGRDDVVRGAAHSYVVQAFSVTMHLLMHLARASYNTHALLPSGNPVFANI